MNYRILGFIGDNCVIFGFQTCVQKIYLKFYSTYFNLNRCKKVLDGPGYASQVSSMGKHCEDFKKILFPKVSFVRPIFNVN